MTEFIVPALMPAFPEIFLAIMAMFLLLLGVSGEKVSYHTVARFSILSLLAGAILVWRIYGADVSTFGDMFVVDAFGSFMKMLVMIGSVASILMATRYAERERIMRFEYPVLIMFSTIGMMLMISANDLMSLYMGLELQSLPLYVLAALQRDTVRSTEAGTKYFILGALASGLLLYGASLIYGFTGATGFTEIAMAVSDGEVSAGVLVGMVLLLCGLVFKISAVPFHMWTPDVYEGAPSSVTAFFAIAPKIAAIALIIRVLIGPFGGMMMDWQQVVILLSVASMIWGAVAAIPQSNIKRLLAYSSIGHMGYALVGLAAGGAFGVQSVMIYIFLYMVMSIGVFCVVLMMKQQDRMVESISDLSGLAKTHPMLALAMAILMFSMAGIPPLAGFFGKLFVFQAAVQSGLYTLAVIGVLTSVIAAYYYLRVIKIMYFDEPLDDGLDALQDPALNFLLTVSSILMLVFIALPGPLLQVTEAAARSLLP